MDVRQLSYVVAVVDHGTFTRAAEMLQIAQPSLSQGIRGLETELGVELFERTARPVRLTPAGQALLEPARRARARSRHGPRRRGRRARPGRRPSRPGVAAHSLDRPGGRPRRPVPPVPIPASPSACSSPRTPPTSPPWCGPGRCELGACELPLPDRAGVVTHELAVAALPGGAAGPGHGAGPAVAGARRQPSTPLAQLPLVTTPLGTSTRRVLDEAFEAAGRRPQVAVETDHRESLVPLVLAGAGAARRARQPGGRGTRSGRDDVAARPAAQPARRPDPPRRPALARRRRVPQPRRARARARPPTAARRR